MRLLKSTLVIVIILALTYTVNANVSFNALSKVKVETSSSIQNEVKSSSVDHLSFNSNVAINQIASPTTKTSKLPLNGDILFAFTAIATIGAYMGFKRYL